MVVGSQGEVEVASETNTQVMSFAQAGGAVIGREDDHMYRKSGPLGQGIHDANAAPTRKVSMHEALIGKH
jgi:hypothetical protein